MDNEFDGKNDSETSINIATGHDKNGYHAEIYQPKESKGFVLVITAYGTKTYQQDILDVLKPFDFDDDYSISVQDITGGDALEPGYVIPEEFISSKDDLKN